MEEWEEEAGGGGGEMHGLSAGGTRMTILMEGCAQVNYWNYYCITSLSACVCCRGGTDKQGCSSRAGKHPSKHGPGGGRAGGGECPSTKSSSPSDVMDEREMARGRCYGHSEFSLGHWAAC